MPTIYEQMQNLPLSTDVATQEELNSALNTISNDISCLSDIYELSGEVVDGISNTINPKLDTIANLVSTEVAKVDKISSALSNYASPETMSAYLSAYLPLSGGTLTGKLYTHDKRIVINGEVLSGLYKTNDIAINAIVSGDANLAIGGWVNEGIKTIVGNHSTVIHSTAGNPVLSGDYSIAIGGPQVFGDYSVGMGYYGSVYGNNSIAINARVSADNAIQLGDSLFFPNWKGNSEASSFNVFDYKMLDKDGLIPDARLCSNIVRNSEISGFISKNDLSDCLKLSGGTMDGPIYSKDGFGLGLRNSILGAQGTNAKLCATYYVHGDEEYLLNNADENNKKILITFESLFPYSEINSTIIPLDLSVLGGLQVGTYELSFVVDPDYEDFTDQGYVWEYATDNPSTNNFKIVVGKQEYPPEKENYKYFGLDVESILKVQGEEDLELWFSNSEHFDLEQNRISYGEESPLASQKYVDSKLSGYVPLTAYQALENRLSALESRLSDIETIVDQINGNN